MADVEVSYCTREQVQRELGYADSARLNKRVDEKILQGARDIEGWCHRKFYPWTGTRKFDVPQTSSLWLHDHELTSIDSIVSGAATMAATDFIARPESGPPYGWLDVNDGGSIGWESNSSYQRAIAITGTYHYPVVQRASCLLAEDIGAGSTAVILDSSSDVGVGSLILIGSERMVVLEKSLVTTGATLAADLPASKGATTVSVSDGTVLDRGEMIAIDGERMYVESITGNTLVVTRGENGSTLAAHTSGATVYAPRIADVARAQGGTLSAVHAADTQIYLLLAPSLVQEANLALACAALEHGSSGYARTAGTGDSQRQADDRGLGRLMEGLYTRYGRKARSRAVM